MTVIMNSIPQASYYKFRQGGNRASNNGVVLDTNKISSLEMWNKKVESSRSNTLKLTWINIDLKKDRREKDYNFVIIKAKISILV